MNHHEFNLVATDGQSLFGQSWEPAMETKAAIALVHGIGEHSSRYASMAAAYTAAGFAVMSMDLRGHGRSGGKRGHAPNYDLLMDDISQLLETTQKQYPDKPLFLYGHSLGGNLVIHYVLKRKPDLTGLIATSPLLRLAYQVPSWKIALLNLLYVLRINWPISRDLDRTAMSHDPKVIEEKQNDPLNHTVISPQLAVDMLRNGEWNLTHASELSIPILLMHGDADRITSAHASQEFTKSAAPLCHLKIWNGLYHELHNETEKHEIYTYVMNWISTKI